MDGITAAKPLQVEGFGRRYRRDRPWAVRGLTLDIPVGSATALVGPNGAGKSTLLRSCIGFERPDEGRVLVFGVDPNRHRAAALEQIAFVPQQTVLDRNLTIADHIALADAARQGYDPVGAKGYLSDLGLRAHWRVADLSGGEQAQVALALALATRAPLILLDEPLGSLDPLARRDFLNLLVHELRVRGATAVLSSHLISDIEHSCDRLAVLGAGRLLLSMSMQEAQSHYRVWPGDVQMEGAVGSFAGPDGLPRTLASASGGRAATVEEIVLGHLAAARRVVE